MSSRYMPILVIAAAVITVSPVYAAAPEAKVKTLIQSLYDRENAAADNKDARGMLAYVSPTFVGVDSSGKRVTYADMKDSIRQLLTLASGLEAGTVVRECKVTGDKAVVSVDDDIRLVISSDGQPSAHVDETSSSTDTWSKTSTGWRMVASRVLSHLVTVDGQPAPDVPGM